MNVRFLTPAREELVEAFDRYERIQDGLGRRFWAEVDEHVAWITRNPEVPTLRMGGYRRVNLRIFPFYPPYIARGKVLWVLAVAHAHRLPEYWIGRRSAARP